MGSFWLRDLACDAVTNLLWLRAGEYKNILTNKAAVATKLLWYCREQRHSR